jgi:hypothetical protein
MKASPLAVFLAMLIVLFVVMPSVVALFFPAFGDEDGLLTPTGMFTHAQKANDTTENALFGMITPSMKPSEMTIVIESFRWGGPICHAIERPLRPPALVDTIGSSYSNNITSIFHTDLGKGEKVSSGDCITIALSHVGSGSEVYGVWVAYTPGNHDGRHILQMVGQATRF